MEKEYRKKSVYPLKEGQMNIESLIDQLNRSEPEVARSLEIFKESSKIYQDTLEAMGILRRPISEVTNTAKVTISFKEETV